MPIADILGTLALVAGGAIGIALRRRQHLPFPLYVHVGAGVGLALGVWRAADFWPHKLAHAALWVVWAPALVYLTFGSYADRLVGSARQRTE